jgi:polysaccharide export outer membrane protein
VARWAGQGGWCFPPTATLADVIALAGGYRGEAKDIVVQLLRGKSRLEYRLSDVNDGGAVDLRVQPGDRVDLIKKHQTFAVLGRRARWSRSTSRPPR